MCGRTILLPPLTLSTMKLEQLNFYSRFPRVTAGEARKYLASTQAVIKRQIPSIKGEIPIELKTFAPSQVRYNPRSYSTEDLAPQ
jgi:hypothetical protein